MKRFLFLALMVLLAVTARASEIHGSWTAERAHDNSSRLQMELSYEDHSHWGRDFDLLSFHGLSDAQIDSKGETTVAFEMRREAGTLAFRGLFENGQGVGHFTFTPDRGYFAKLTAMGVSVTEKDDPDQQLLGVAIADVSTDFISGMRAEGYSQTLEEYVRMRIFDVTRPLLAAYAKRGYEHIPFEQLIAFRIHGVTPEYIDGMRDAGYPHLSAEDLVRSRIHGATPEFARQLGDLGYANLPMEELVRFRIHGVSVERVRDFEKLGYKGVESDEMVQMAIHGVTPEFVRDLQGLGYNHVPVDELVRMRIHGVTPDYIRELKDAGYSGIPPEKLIEMRIHGISADFVKKTSRN